MPVLTTWTPSGGVLGAVAPLALAAAAGTALVVDLDPAGPSYPGRASLTSLVADGPRRGDLIPPRSGVAVLRNGGVDEAASRAIVDALCEGWPAVVLRRTGALRPDGARVAPIRPLLPGPFFAAGPGPAVHQRCGWAVRAPGPGPVLPRPSAGTLRSLLEGRRPPASRWIRAWHEVWEHPWT